MGKYLVPLKEKVQNICEKKNYIKESNDPPPLKGEGLKYLWEEKLYQSIEWPPPPTLERSAYHAYLRLWSGLRGWDDNPEVWTRRRRPSSLRRYLRVWRTRGRISVPGDLKHGGAWSRGALEHRISAFISATVDWYTDRHTKPWRLASAALIIKHIDDIFLVLDKFDNKVW